MLKQSVDESSSEGSEDSDDSDKGSLHSTSRSPLPQREQLALCWLLSASVYIDGYRMEQRRFAARVRAWPLAWPSPSGPLGWQRLRRSRAGPEDRFCEAVLETIFGCP